MTQPLSKAHAPELHGGSVRGVGLGLRSPHMEYILKHNPDVPWFELLTDNWLDAAGIDGFLLDQVSERYPLTLHGVCMNVGGTQPLNFNYLGAVKRLAKRCDITLVSDHLAFSAVDGKQLHGLGPMPLTGESLAHCILRINTIQDFLGQAISIENISAYVACAQSSLSEASFMNELADASGCKILLDVNNLHVNKVNLGVSAVDFIHQIKQENVSEIHLGGYTHKGDFLLDAHNNPVSDPVWLLYEKAMKKFQNVPTLIEWDNDLPEFETLLKEKQKAMSFNTTESNHAVFA